MSVIFEKDWYNPDGTRKAYVHAETKNRSFYRTAKLLQTMGIRNWKFMLCLYDPGLKNVDPHAINDSNDPTGSIRERIAVEAYRNIWYYIRECVRIPVEGGVPIPYELHRGNLAMTWCFANSIDFSATQPRQTGKGQPLDAKIKIPGGWTTMGKLKVGDVISAPDGTTTKVIGVYPQGKKKVYRLTFADGRTTRCDDSHLWKVRTNDGSWEIISMADIVTGYENGNRYTIPLIKSLNKNDGVMSSLLREWDKRTVAVKQVADAVQDCIRRRGGICKVTQTPEGKYQTDIDITSTEIDLTDVTYVGEEDTQCIMVDHPEHLYITDDYIVTHNTIGACVCSSWIEYITGFRFTIAMLTHNAKLVRDNVKRMKAIRDCLPSYLIYKSKNDVDNKEGLSYAALGNSYVTYIGSKDRAAADNVGRGATAPIIHVDEIGFIANIDISFEVIMSSTNAARQNAIRNGQLHGNLYTTTAADPMTKSGKYAFEFINRAMPFTEHLYDVADIAAAKAMVRSNSKNQVVNGTFSYLQLGKTHEWFHDTINRNNVSPEGVKRDYLNQWISAAKNPILSKESLKVLNDSKMEPVFTELFNEFVVNWYVPKDMALSRSYRNKRLILGMDSSETIGNDFTAFVCIDPKDLSVVFTFRCNDVNTTKIGLLAARLLFDFPNMIFVPERKNTGVGITDAVTDALRNRGINPFRRIFNTIVQNKGMKEFDNVDPTDANLVDIGQYRKRIGFMTSGPTRNVIYKSVLQRAANLAGDKARDHNLVNELGALQVINGRIDHTNGNHDDTVIAWLLACYLVLEGRNLHFYGLGPDDLMSPEDVASKKNDVIYLKSQISLRRKIRDLEDRIAAANNDSLQRIYMAEIKRLRTYVDDDVSIEPISRDVVGNDFREYNEMVASSQSRDNVSNTRYIDPMKLIGIF